MQSMWTGSLGDLCVTGGLVPYGCDCDALHTDFTHTYGFSDCPCMCTSMYVHVHPGAGKLLLLSYYDLETLTHVTVFIRVIG